MANKICGIYGIHNTLTGEWYVGQSTNILNRVSFHFSELRRGIHFCRKMQADYDAHGAEIFSFSILEMCEKSDLDKVEQKWISEKEAMEYGYNQTKGGAGRPAYKWTNAMRERMREVMSGENNPNYGIPVPEERKQRISEKMRVCNAHLRRSVVCVETGEVYASISAAAKSVGKNFSTLSEARKNGTTCGGYHWQFHEEVAS